MFSYFFVLLRCSFTLISFDQSVFDVWIKRSNNKKNRSPSTCFISPYTTIIFEDWKDYTGWKGSNIRPILPSKKTPNFAQNKQKKIEKITGNESKNLNPSANKKTQIWRFLLASCLVNFCSASFWVRSYAKMKKTKIQTGKDTSLRSGISSSFFTRFDFFLMTKMCLNMLKMLFKLRYLKLSRPPTSSDFRLLVL